MQQYDHKAFVITMKGRSFSEELAEDCIASGKKINLKIEKFDAIQLDDVAPTYKKFGLRPFPKLKFTRDTKGVRGCFCSHYSLWLKCIELNEPIMILEHDALFMRPIPKDIVDKFSELCNLDAYSRTSTVYEDHLEKFENYDVITHQPKKIASTSKNAFQYYDKECIKGLHAYIIKPQGAKSLIAFTKNKGMLPADVHVNAQSVALTKTKYSLCRINPKYWLDKSKKSKNSYTRTDV
jgi:glycosyl transferase family 25